MKIDPNWSVLDRVPPYASIGAAFTLWSLVYLPLLPFSVSDFENFVKPWLDYIRAHGGFRALGDNFSEYAPPYLYALAAVSYFDWPFDDQTLVKLVSAPFAIFAAIVVYFFCRHFAKTRNYSFCAASGVAVLPTLGINAFVWGQADVIYTPFVLCCVLLLLKNKPYWATALFAIALSMKLQAIFLAPFLAALVIAGRIPLKAAWVAILVYTISILPAFLLGRPLIELLTIYLVQGKFYHHLSFNAPNPYAIVELLINLDVHRDVYKIGAIIGLPMAALIGAAFALGGAGRKDISDRLLLTAATLSMVLMPFVLPKMHDRFFFGADLFTYALAVVAPRFWWAALALQLSSLLAYAPEFSIYALPGDPSDWRPFVLIGAAINAAVIYFLARALKDELGIVWDWPALRQRWRNLLNAMRLRRSPAGE